MPVSTELFQKDYSPVIRIYVHSNAYIDLVKCKIGFQTFVYKYL